MSQQTSATEQLPPPADAGAPIARRSPEHAQTQAELRAFLVSLLQYQCALVGASAGLVYLRGTRARRAGVWARFVSPSSGAGIEDALADQSAVKRLERMGEQAAALPLDSAGARPAGIVETITLASAEGIYEARPTHRVLASALVAENSAEGACILLVPVERPVDPADCLARLSLTGARFESFLWRQQCLAEAQHKTRLRETLELLDTAQQGASADAMGALICHELQRRFGCTRVSVGLIQRGRIRLAAVSGADDLDRRGPAVEALEDAMDECADQDIEVLYPAPPELEADPSHRRVTRAHESLVARFGPASVLSLPLRVEGDLVGVALLERDADDPFPPGAIPLVRLVAEFIGPALWTRRLADRGILAVTRDRVNDLGHAIVGPRHTGAKLLGVVAILVFLALAAIPIPGRITAAAEVKAAQARTISPPFAGYIAAVLVRPGDEVRPGQPLAQMDTSELELSLVELHAQRASLATQRDDAQTQLDLAKARRLGHDIAEIQARIDFLSDRIAHSEVKAPIAGKVSRGDLEAFVGARVDPSQPLFEIVAGENLAVIQVDERDIGRVYAAQAGTLASRALPGRKVPIVVERINPVAQAVRGTNAYLVEATVEAEAAWLRPGMTGTVRLRDGWTTGLSRIMRPLIDELRLRWWW